MLSTSDLSRAEKLYLKRKRMGLTQVEMSVDCGVSLNEYRGMESDAVGTRPPYVALGTLEDREVYVILRHRSGLSSSEIAEEIGVSTYWLRQMEGGDAPIKRLQAYWGADL